MGLHTVTFKNKPCIVSTGTIAGPKEVQGIVGKYVDCPLQDDTFGEDTYEKAECKMLSYAISKAIEKSGFGRDNIDLMVSGDLLNQIISASFAARDFDFPFLGVYGACSTMAEAFALAACLIDAGYMKRIGAATGSHFSSAERQYRFPLEQGTTRPPQSQWTVTGAGGAVIADSGSDICITSATFGKVVDYGVTDVNNMGAAMAPAACSTILRHLQERKLDPGYYALINSYLYRELKAGKLNKILRVATGARLSTVSAGQGESIPCIAHAVSIERAKEKAPMPAKAGKKKEG